MEVTESSSFVLLPPGYRGTEVKKNGLPGVHSLALARTRQLQKKCLKVSSPHCRYTVSGSIIYRPMAQKRERSGFVIGGSNLRDLV